MKKIAILLATGMIAAMSACSDAELDIENGNSLNTSNFWKTESDAEKGLVAVYKCFTVRAHGPATCTRSSTAWPTTV